MSGCRTVAHIDDQSSPRRATHRDIRFLSTTLRELRELHEQLLSAVDDKTSMVLARTCVQKMAHRRVRLILSVGLMLRLGARQGQSGKYEDHHVTSLPTLTN
jgi:hypothetical protein